MNSAGTFDLKQALKKLTEPDYINGIVKNIEKTFSELNFVNRFVFSKYHQLIADVRSFKNALLKFILEAKIHLSLLRDNMATQRFEQLSDEKKLIFMKGRLDRINRYLLLDYINSCKKLIETSMDIYKEYGTKRFKIKYAICNILGFAAIGAAAGFAIGLVLPFISIIEAGAGAIVGCVGGLAFVIYQFIYKWDDQMKEIEMVRDHLKQIHDGLVDIEKQLQTSHTELGKSQTELIDKINQEAMLEIKDIQNYINSTYEQFIALQNILQSVKFDEKED